MSGIDPVARVRRYYRTIDQGAYDALADLLASDFVQVRTDRTLEGRAAFLRFMREDRPATDTTHEIDAIYRDPRGEPSAESSADEVAVRGRLRRADGSIWFGYVDVFWVTGPRLSRLVTYLNDRTE